MDRGPMFPEIGRIRKGAAKKEGENRPGKDLTYFRFEIDENEKEAIEFIKKLYPGEPAALRILLPFRTVEENFQSCREAWVAGGLLHRCDWENHQVQFQRDENGKTVVSNGHPIIKCKGDPVGEYKKRDTKEVVPVFCKPVGRLKVIIPELMRMVFFTVMTSSVHDIENLRAELLAYEGIGPKGLAGIPLILKRVPKKISTPMTDGTRARREKWLLHVEVDPKWAKKVMIALADASMPDQPALEAPKNVSEGEWRKEEEEEEPEEFSKSVPAEDFGIPVEEESHVNEIPYPAKLDETMYYSYAKKIKHFAEAQAIMSENKGDVKKSWAGLLKGFVPESEWPR